jgi:hypothetical protein
VGGRERPRIQTGASQVGPGGQHSVQVVGIKGDCIAGRGGARDELHLEQLAYRWRGRLLILLPILHLPRPWCDIWHAGRCGLLSGLADGCYSLTRNKFFISGVDRPHGCECHFCRREVAVSSWV